MWKTLYIFSVIRFLQKFISFFLVLMFVCFVVFLLVLLLAIKRICKAHNNTKKSRWDADLQAFAVCSSDYCSVYLLVFKIVSVDLHFVCCLTKKVDTIDEIICQLFKRNFRFLTGFGMFTNTPRHVTYDLVRHWRKIKYTVFRKVTTSTEIPINKSH